MKTFEIPCVHPKSGRMITMKVEAYSFDHAVIIVKKKNPELKIR